MKLKNLLLGSALALGMMHSALADVKFGELYPFSGQLALLGEESARGLELAVDQINAEGGIGGQKVVLVRGDAVDNNQAIGEARRLITLENVKAIFGTYSSSRVIAASQVAELSGRPYFELGAVASEVTTRHLKYLYRTNPTAKDMAQTVIDMLTQQIAPALHKDPKDLKIGIIYENSSYGTSVSGFETQFAKAAGLNVVYTTGYPDNTVDMSSLVLQLRSQGADVVLQTSYQNDSVLFLQQAHQANYKPLAIIGGGGGYSMMQTEQAVGQNVIDGVYDVDFTQYNIKPSFTPGIDKFLDAYKKKFGQDPRSGHSLTNYVGALAILEAIKKGGGTSPDQILSEVNAIDIPDGGTAAGYGVKFDANNQNERAKMMGMQWQDGKLVTIYPAAAAVAPLRLNQ